MIRKFGIRDAMTNAREAATLTRRVSAGSPGGGTSASLLTVSEEDASPLVENVIELQFPNDKVTDLGSGRVHIDVSGDGLSYVSEVTGTPITGIVGIVVSDDTLTDLGGGVVQIDLRRVLSMAEPGDVPRVYPVTEIRVPDGTLIDLGDGNVQLDIVAAARTVTAGAGLTGGGALSANITIDVATADTSMTINADSIQVRLATNSGMQISSGLQLGTPTTVTTTSTNAVTTTTHSHAIDSTIVPATRTVTAGAGLTGGGALSGDITIDVATADTSMTINANSIQVRLAATSGLSISTGLMIDDSVAGAGLTISSKVLAVGAGNGITVNANDVALTTPGTLTVSTTNAAAGNHTHAITSSDDPGAAARILATDSSGGLRLHHFNVGSAAAGTSLGLVTASRTISTGSGQADFTVVDDLGLTHSYAVLSHYRNASTGLPIFAGRSARGTRASPTATQSGDVLAVFAGQGYGATDFSNLATSAVVPTAAENWTDSAYGAHLDIYTTPAGSTSPAVRARVTSEGDVGINTTSPQGRLHGYDTIGGFIYWEYDGVDATARTIIANGTGDVLYRFQAVYVVRDSGGGVSSGQANVSVSGNSDIYTDGTDTLNLRVNADGSVDVRRTAGTATFKVAMWCVWI